MTRKKRPLVSRRKEAAAYDGVLAEVVRLIDAARRTAARSVNAVMTTTYFLIGRRIVELEQRGVARAAYGEEVVVRLSRDLQARFGRGFGRANLFQMRAFYLAYSENVQTVSGLLPNKTGRRIVQTASGQFDFIVGCAAALAAGFPLPWSHYARLLAVRSREARRFYETEALRGVGRSASSTGRLGVSSTSGRCCRETRPPCCEARRSASLRTSLRRSRRSKNPTCSNFWT